MIYIKSVINSVLQVIDCSRRLRGSTHTLNFSMGLRPRLSAAAASRLYWSIPHVDARGIIYSRIAAPTAGGGSGESGSSWAGARGIHYFENRCGYGGSPFQRGRRGRGPQPGGPASTPHRISLRLAARLLRLPLKGGVIIDIRKRRQSPSWISLFPLCLSSWVFTDPFRVFSNPLVALRRPSWPFVDNSFLSVRG